MKSIRCLQSDCLEGMKTRRIMITGGQREGLGRSSCLVTWRETKIKDRVVGIRGKDRCILRVGRSMPGRGKYVHGGAEGDE